ncbi:MAG: glycosyltransferase family 39 protein [Myxococcota bacterium]
MDVASDAAPPAPATAARRRKELGLLCGVVALGLLAFLDKPVHVDDPVYLWVAERIQTHPTDPYGFELNWHGTRDPVHAIQQNPPGVSYAQASVRSVFGPSIAAQHGVALVWALGALLGVYLLAERFTRSPGVATALVATTPAFFVSATTLMSDLPMLACWCGAIACWVRGLDRGSTRWLVVGGSLIGVAALTKYFAVALLPLLAAYTALRGVRAPRVWAVFALPVSVLVGFEAAAHGLYGHGLLSQVPGYATGVRQYLGQPWWNDAIVALAFIGGCAFPLPLLTGGASDPRGRVLGALALLALVGAVVAWSPLPYEIDVATTRGWVLVHVVIFAWAGACLVALGVAGARRAARDPDHALLVLWGAGVFAFVAFFNWSANARAVLPLVPAAALGGVRAWEARAGSPLSLVRAAPLLALGAALSLSVAHADRDWATGAMRMARQLAHDYGAGAQRVFFQGHWGFQYYFESAGGRAYDVHRDRLVPGDIVIMPRNNVHLTQLDPSKAIELEVRDAGRTSPWSLMGGGAGFYSSVWGPVPFSLGPSAPELYRVLEVRAPIPPRPALGR